MITINIPFRGLFRYDETCLSPDNYPHKVEKWEDGEWHACPSVGAACRIREELNKSPIMLTGVWNVGTGKEKTWLEK